MFERILVPLDGSAMAEAVLPHVERVLAKPESEIILLRVTELLFADGVPPLEPLIDEAQQYLKGVYNRMSALEARVRARIEHGMPVRTILRVAEEEGATLIAMASHGRSGLARVLLGSVSEGVVRSSGVPLYLVRATGRPIEPRSIRKVLVPIGGGDLSLRILPHVSEFARAQGAEVLMLHVAEQDMESVAMTRGAEERIRSDGVPVGAIFDEGDPAVVILDIARQGEVDLIAMTTHARNLVSQMIFGSVTQRVFRDGNLPILVTNARRAAPIRSNPIPAKGSTK